MIAATVLVFAAVFILVLALTNAVIKASQSPTAKLKSRLRRMAKSEEHYDSAGESILHEKTRVQTLIYRLPMMQGVHELIERAGLRITPVVFLLATVAASGSAFILTFLLRKNVYTALSLAIGTGCAPFLFLVYRKKQREDKFTEQLPDVLTMISRSLRAGHSLTGAVELVGGELAEPAGALFKLAYEQQRLGMRMADALATLPNKINSMDLQFFVTIIKINSDTGGNLAEILDKLAETIRSRLQIRRQVQVYTAEGRVSGYVLVILPVFVFALFYLMHPNYMDVFFTERSCQLSLIGAGLAQVVGFLFIRKIINIRI